MTEPIEARVTVLEKTMLAHQRELDTLKAMDEYFAKHVAVQTENIGTIKRDVKKLQDDTNERFNRVDERFDRVDERFDRMETRIENRFKDIEYLLQDIRHQFPPAPGGSPAPAG